MRHPRNHHFHIFHSLFTLDLLNMQAITTKFLPCTNYKGSRVKASCERGSLTISWDHGLNAEDNHIKAVETLCNKFVGEDIVKYGADSKSPWNNKKAYGWLKNGMVAVFTGEK